MADKDGGVKSSWSCTVITRTCVCVCMCMCKGTWHSRAKAELGHTHVKTEIHGDEQKLILPKIQLGKQMFSNASNVGKSCSERDHVPQRIRIVQAVINGWEWLKSCCKHHPSSVCVKTSLSKVTKDTWEAGEKKAGRTSGKWDLLSRQIERKLNLVFCHVLLSSCRMMWMSFRLDFGPAGDQRTGARWVFHKQGPRRWYPLINRCLGPTMLM